MKTPDITKCFRDPAAYPESASSREYFRGPGKGPEQPRVSDDRKGQLGDEDDAKTDESY
jgi:hypothetical protein